MQCSAGAGAGGGGGGGGGGRRLSIELSSILSRMDVKVVTGANPACIFVPLLLLLFLLLLLSSSSSFFLLEDFEKEDIDIC